MNEKNNGKKSKSQIKVELINTKIYYKKYRVTLMEFQIQPVK